MTAVVVSLTQGLNRAVASLYQADWPLARQDVILPERPRSLANVTQLLARPPQVTARDPSRRQSFFFANCAVLTRAARIAALRALHQQELKGLLESVLPR